MSWVELTVAVVVFASLLKGFREGLILQVMSSLGLFVALLFYFPLSTWLIRHHPELSEFRSIVSVFSFLVLFMPFYLAGLITGYFLYSEGLELSIPLKAAGGLTGIFRGIILSTLIVGFLHQYTWLNAEQSTPGRCLLKIYPATSDFYRRLADEFKRFLSFF